MHKFYLDWIKEKSTLDPRVLNGTLRQYIDIFNNNFNLSFFKLKKDQCDVCEENKLANLFEKTKMQIVYDMHIKNKTLARLKKNLINKRH